jgi:exosome complex RNA-binding protein Rrp4
MASFNLCWSEIYYLFSWLQVGDLLYAKLLVANKDVEPELVCIDSNGKSNGMGVIKGGGFVVHTSCSLARKLVISAVIAC